MTDQLIIDGTHFSLPLVGRAGVGGIPIDCGSAFENNFDLHGVPPSLTLPHEGGGNLRGATS